MGCYCQRRITNPANPVEAGKEAGLDQPESDSCHIEHFKPQHQFSELSLDYTNLLASCQAEQSKHPPPPLRCGHKKGQWYDEQSLVSPLQPDCESFFQHSSTGEILPSADPEKQVAAEVMIDRLGLNIDKLRERRRRAIDAIVFDIDSLTDAEIQRLT